MADLRYISLIVFCMTLASCKKTITNDPVHLISLEKMWKVKNDARAAVFGSYGVLRTALSDQNRWFVYGELRGGDFESNGRRDLKAVVNNNLYESHGALQGLKDWTHFYAAISHANLCLEKLPLIREKDNTYDENLLKLDLANVTYVRALTYFYLVRVWGKVPLLTGYSNGEFAAIHLEDPAVVLNFIKQDLIRIAKDLPWQYNGEFPEQDGGNYWELNNYHLQASIANKASVYALLAHIEAWNGNYLDAEFYAKLIMENRIAAGLNITTTSTLTNTNGGVFFGKAENLILALSANKAYQEHGDIDHLEKWTLASPFVSSQDPTLYINNKRIANIFKEPKDERFEILPDGTTKGGYFYGYGNSFPLFRKIMQLTISNNYPLEEYQSAIVIFRYEDIVLLRAEAMFFLNNREVSLRLLNSIRVKRGLLEIVDGNGLDLGTAILEERRKELLGEGWRWYDLVRFDKVPNYTTLKNEDIDRGAMYWPVAQRILDNNELIQQNNFWK